MTTLIKSGETRIPDNSTVSGVARNPQGHSLAWITIILESIVLAVWLIGAIRYNVQAGRYGTVALVLALVVLGISALVRSSYWLQCLRSNSHYIRPAAWIFLMMLFLPGHLFSQSLDLKPHVIPLLMVLLWIFSAEIRFSSTYRAKTFSLMKMVDSKSPQLLATFAVLYCVVTSVLAIRKLHDFGYVGQDIAYFMQCLYTGLHGKFFASNQYHDLLYTTTVHSDFAGHNQPVLFLLLPFYWIAPSAVTLFVIRNVFMALCVIPAYKIARMWMHPLPALLSVIGLMLAPAVLYQNFYDYAPLSMVGLPLLFALQFYFQRRYTLFLVMLVCCLLVREDLVFVLVGFGVIALLARRKWHWSVIPISLSIFWVVLTWGLILPYFQAGAVSAVQGCFSYLGSTPKEMLITAITQPKMLLTHKIFVYLNQIFTPSGLAIAFVSPISVISIPYVLINILGDQGCNAAIAFRHYSLIPALLLFPGSVYFAAWLRKNRSRVKVSSISMGLLFFFAGAGTTLMATGRQELSWWHGAGWHQEARQVAAMLPVHSAVAVPRYMLPLVANREEVYQSLRLLEYHHPDANYVVLDKNDERMGVAPHWESGYDELRSKLNDPDRFTLVYSSSNYLIYKRTGEFLKSKRPSTVVGTSGGCA